MRTHFHATNLVPAICGPLVLIALLSTQPKLRRSRVVGVLAAVAAGTYINAGFGAWELAASFAMGAVAYQGIFGNDAMVGIAWIMHAGWDFLHHLNDVPLIDLIPSSAIECAITDIILAGWALVGFPSIFSK